jgi:hypothetical protein
MIVSLHSSMKNYSTVVAIRLMVDGLGKKLSLRRSLKSINRNVSRYVVPLRVIQTKLLFILVTLRSKLACTCCGIIVNYKEFYGAESCTQVALFYLETIDNYKGIFTGN